MSEYEDKYDRRLLARCRDLEASLAEAREESNSLREALTPSAETKAAYMSEVMCDHFPSCEAHGHYVPWTTIKDVMAMISKRALTGGESE